MLFTRFFFLFYIYLKKYISLMKLSELTCIMKMYMLIFL
jgi:hypothetical protein